jgi:hypothetical protein
MELVRDGMVKTRALHQCWGCVDDIPIGSTVYASVGVDCGAISTAYWCGKCKEFLDNLESWEREDGFAMGELNELMREKELH